MYTNKDCGKRICPCCGKPLKLAPPNKELLPNRYGISANGIPFYLISDMRYIPYTLMPESVSEFRTVSLYKCGNIGRYWLSAGRQSSLTSEASRNHFNLKIITIARTERAINKDKLFNRGGWALAFFCEHCHSKLALNYNPLVMLDGNFFWLLLFPCLLLFCLTININVFLSAFFAVLPLAVFSLLSALSALSYIFIKLTMSNFVITNRSDALITPNEELSVSSSEINHWFVHKSNIFKTEIDGNTFYLYLTAKQKNIISLHICGISGEPERLTALLKEKMSNGEKVYLPLEFEGKSIGTAELLEVFDCNKNRNSTGKERYET